MRMPIASFLGAALLASGCTAPRHAETRSGGQVISASPAVNAPTSVNPSSSGPSVILSPGASAADRTIASEVQRVLQGGELANNVAIAVHNGVVTLTGAVLNDQQRQMIDSLAQSVNGVTSVQDHLRVTSPEPGYGASAGVEPPPTTGRLSPFSPQEDPAKEK